MSNTDLIIEERSRDIGDFLVGRLIPFKGILLNMIGMIFGEVVEKVYFELKVVK